MKSRFRLFNRAVFKWLSKVITWLRLLRLVIGLKDSRQFFNQWEAKPNPIAPCTRDFSRASSEWQVLARNCDWFIALSAPGCCDGRSNCFGFGFSTVNWKPLYSFKQTKWYRLLWSGWKHAFVKQTWQAVDPMNVTYDYSSIMHYKFNAFSRSRNRKTILPLIRVRARPYRRISRLDALQANMMYKCHGKFSKGFATLPTTHLMIVQSTCSLLLSLLSFFLFAFFLQCINIFSIE